MLRIRLTRRGAKKDPHYRVVVAEQESPRDGRFKEIVGFYNPAKQPVLLSLQLDRVDYWLENGAQPTETVKTLIRRVRESGETAVQQSEEEAKEPETSEKS